jgi:hypothetical protein
MFEVVEGRRGSIGCCHEGARAEANDCDEIIVLWSTTAAFKVTIHRQRKLEPPLFVHHLPKDLEELSDAEQNAANRRMAGAMAFVVYLGKIVNVLEGGKVRPLEWPQAIRLGSQRSTCIPDELRLGDAVWSSEQQSLQQCRDIAGLVSEDDQAEPVYR